MATAEINLRLKYSDAFDFEDLRGIMHKVLEKAKADGLLDFEEGGERFECLSVGHVCPDWMADSQ